MSPTPSHLLTPPHPADPKNHCTSTTPAPSGFLLSSWRTWLLWQRYCCGQHSEGSGNQTGQHSTKLSWRWLLQEEPVWAPRASFTRAQVKGHRTLPCPASVWATRTASKSNSPKAHLFAFMISKNIIRGSRSSGFIFPPSFKITSARWVQ